MGLNEDWFNPGKAAALFTDYRDQEDKTWVLFGCSIDARNALYKTELLLGE